MGKTDGFHNPVKNLLYVSVRGVRCGLGKPYDGAQLAIIRLITSGGSVKVVSPQDVLATLFG